jgi:hypothetical protein
MWMIEAYSRGRRTAMSYHLEDDCYALGSVHIDELRPKFAFDGGSTGDIRFGNPTYGGTGVGKIDADRSDHSTGFDAQEVRHVALLANGAGR